MKKILFVVGSFRKGSFNLQLAKRAAQDLKDRADCSFLDFRDIPYMDQDIEFPTPAAIASVREQVAAADGVWFVTPEYNASYPGLLKNLIDWLSRAVTPDGPRDSATIWGVKCAVTSVGGGAHGERCIAEMKKLLPFVGAKLMPETLGIGYTREEDDTSVLQMTEERMTALAAQEDAFLQYLQDSEAPFVKYQP